jgi:PAS domain-containing protein
MNGADRAAHGRLKLIGGGAEAPDEHGRVAFCGHCGLTAPRSRHGVCVACGVGVLIETDADAVPQDEGFIVVDPSLRVLAVSERAENVLGAYEQDVSGRPVTRYLIPAHPPRRTKLNYATAIYDALSAGLTQWTWARLAGNPTVLLRLRIAACTSPRAALVVFESPRG